MSVPFDGGRRRAHSATSDAPATGRASRRRWRRLGALLLFAALAAWLIPAAAQVTIMQYARQRSTPVNHGLPDVEGGFTFCRVRYERVRVQRKSGWWDDYPASDFNFMTRLQELTTVTISRWANGDPGFAQVTLDDPALFHCPFLKMQGAANYDFTTDQRATLRSYLLKGGFLWEDDNWTDGDWDVIRENLRGLFPEYPIVELTPDHPMLSVLYRVAQIPQIPSIESWRRSGGQTDEFGSGPPHLYGIFDDKGQLMVLVSQNCDTSDSWEREGDNPEYFARFSGMGYAMGVNVAIWTLTH